MYLFSKGLRLEIRVLKFNKDILPPMMFYYLELYSGIGGGRSVSQSLEEQVL